MAPTDVTWTAECETAFQELKRLLCSTPVLASPDFEKPFILQTDASEYGVGAVLSQRDALGCNHPIAYFSRKLLPQEVRYSTVEKEYLAIKLAMETFRVYLLGRGDGPPITGVAKQAEGKRLQALGPLPGML